MASLGYAWLIEQLSLRVCPLATPAEISTSVNRRVATPHRVLFPRGVAVEDTPVGHLEFALRHEGVNLEIVDAVFEHLSSADLCARLEAAPNGVHIRRACFLWEWLTGQELPITVTPAGGYVDLFPAETYVTAGRPTNNRKFRVRNNALGTPEFCPVVLRSAVPESPSLAELLAKAQRTLESVGDTALYERALSFLYLSETQSSFEIEREKPSSDKQERFVQLLLRIPMNLDSDSEPNWTRIPEQTGQSERSDAGFSFLLCCCHEGQVFIAPWRVIHGRPADGAPSIAG